MSNVIATLTCVEIITGSSIENGDDHDSGTPGGAAKWERAVDAGTAVTGIAACRARRLSCAPCAGMSQCLTPMFVPTCMYPLCS